MNFEQKLAIYEERYVYKVNKPILSNWKILPKKILKLVLSSINFLKRLTSILAMWKRFCILFYSLLSIFCVNLKFVRVDYCKSTNETFKLAKCQLQENGISVVGNFIKPVNQAYVGLGNVHKLRHTENCYF